MKKILIIIWAVLHTALFINGKSVQADQPAAESGHSGVYTPDQNKPDPRPPHPRPSGQDSAELRPSQTPEPGQDIQAPSPQYKPELKPPRGFKIIKSK